MAYHAVHSVVESVGLRDWRHGRVGRRPVVWTLVMDSMPSYDDACTCVRRKEGGSEGGKEESEEGRRREKGEGGRRYGRKGRRGKGEEEMKGRK